MRGAPGRSPVLWPDGDDVGPVPDDVPPPAPRRGGRAGTVGRVLAVVAGAALLVAEAVWLVSVVDRPHGGMPAAAAVEFVLEDDVVVAGQADPAADAVVPPAAEPAVPLSRAQRRVSAWADRTAPRVGVPVVALRAYGAAELVLAREQPGCRLSWVALAGIGAVESDHGRHGGATLLPDGRSDPPVVGVALNGNGVATIRDTDGGALDGDPVHDRAVGPMQFIPSTWARYAADGDGDGRTDPYVLPDAALAAGRYLCAAGDGDLRDAGAWTRAVLAYNASRDYLLRVTAQSNAYARASSG